MAIWWVEHVAATKGAPFTKSSSTFLSGYVYHSLDIYTLFLSIALGFAIFCLLTVKICFCCFSGDKKESDREKNKLLESCSVNLECQQNAK